jgi:hypothetical protein
MDAITTEGSAYHGQTSSRPWRLPHDTLDCKRCGSSLHGRREAVRGDTTKGIRFVTEIFRCRCGRGRHVKREVAGTS